MKSHSLFIALVCLLMLTSALFVQCTCGDDDDDDDNDTGNWKMCEHLCQGLLSCNLAAMLGYDQDDSEACSTACTEEKPMEVLECGLASESCDELEDCLSSLDVDDDDDLINDDSDDDDDDSDDDGDDDITDDDTDVICDQERFDLDMEYSCTFGGTSYAGEYDTEGECAVACPEDYSFDAECNWCFCCPWPK